MQKNLEKILYGLKKGIVTAGIAASLFLPGCSEDKKSNPVTSPAPTNPVNPTPPQPNRAPVITSSPITSISEREYYIYQIQATDADGDVLNYYLNKSPSWLIVTNNWVCGWPPEVQTDQTFNVELVASDNKLTTVQNYNLTVKNVSNSYLLSSSQLSGSAVTDNSVSLSQPVTFAVGDIIGAGITPSTPNGLLRQITSISSDKKILQTTQATLEDVTSTSFFTYNGRLSPSSVIYSSVLDGVKMSHSSFLSPTAFNFNINLNNVVLYDKDGNKNTKDDQLIANGNISFDNDIIFNVNISNYKIKDITFRNSTSIESDITVGANVYGLASTYSVKIAEYKFNPITVGYFPPPIPIPIIVVPTLAVYAEISPVNVNPLSLRVKQTANLEALLTYNNNGGWNSSSNFSNNFTFSNPTINGNLELKASAGPQLELMLYGVSGPTAEVEGKLRFKVSNNAKNWEIYGGLEASIGAKLQVLKKGFSAQIAKVIDYEKLLASYSEPTPPPTPIPTPIGEILFTSTRDGNAEVYLMNADGSNSTNLTRNSFHDYDASWSPDKSQFVFVSERNGNAEIYTMKLDGTNYKRLTNNSAIERYPNWSPNGQEIVFYSERNGNKEIFLMNADGSNQRKLNIPFGVHIQPSWSPDGNKIVFASTLAGEGSFDIYKINKDGTGLERLTTDSSIEIEPVWSPDGTKIAFSSNKTSNYFDIWVMNSNGSNKKNISNTTILTYDMSPSWSPDGKKIAFAFGNYNKAEIYVMNSDGTNGVPAGRITNTPSSDNRYPRWSR
jgi:TolB protein